MARIRSEVFFAEEKLKKSFEELKTGKLEEQELHKHIKQALDNLKENAYSGIHIPAKLIPKIYIKKYEITNLWKYDLPRGWRIIYTIGNEGIEVISLILEWMDHKEYERRFNY
jgi:Txe/YoeB family toxin of Txe-Axe toxin-antitoxin module